MDNKIKVIWNKLVKAVTIQRDFRQSIGRFQFICRLAFDKEDFGIRLLDVLYLGGFGCGDEPDRIEIDGFWCIECEFIFITLTLNISDKPKK